MSRALSYFSKRVFQQQKIILFFGTKIISLLNCFFLWDAESMQWVQWIFLSWSVQKFIPSIQTIHPLKRMSKFFSVKSGNIFTVSALWQLNKHSDLSSFRTNVKVFMPREESVFLLLSSTDNPLTLCLLSQQAFAILSHDFWKNHFDQYRTRSKQYLEFVTILSRQRPNSFLWF